MSPAPKAYVWTGRRTTITMKSKRGVLRFRANDIVISEVVKDLLVIDEKFSAEVLPQESMYAKEVLESDIRS
jgi:hypothetical protein